MLPFSADGGGGRGGGGDSSGRAGLGGLLSLICTTFDVLGVRCERLMMIDEGLGLLFEGMRKFGNLDSFFRRPASRRRRGCNRKTRSD